MKFLFDMPNEQLLPATIDLAEAVGHLVEVSNLKSLQTPVQEGEKKEEVAKRNAKNMICKLFREYPKETGEVLDRLWILEKEGEKAPNALVTAGIVLVRKDVLNFFTSLAQLA